MVSIIIPVYNAMPYLQRCLNSVFNSTYQDFELILVNDGSTDNSLDVCQGYASNDKRIKLISQQNKGVSAARNRALEECQGEWIVFIDADDVISPEFLGLVAQENNQVQDFLLFDFSISLEGLLSRKPTSGELLSKTEPMPQLVRRILDPQQIISDGNINFLSPCGKAYRKSLIDQCSLRFLVEVQHEEDRLFNLEYALQTKSCMYIHAAVYFYQFHSDSLAHRFDPKFAQDQDIMLRRIREVLAQYQMFPLMGREFSSYTLDNLSNVLYSFVFHPGNPQTHREKRIFLYHLQKTLLYKQALKYNCSCGRLARRVLISLFRLRWYFAASFICKMNHFYWRIFWRLTTRCY